MDIDSLYDLLQTVFPEPVKEEEPKAQCDHDYRYADGILTCVECGVVEGSYLRGPDRVSGVFTNVRKHLYRRSNYFKEKLNLIAGYNQCIKSGYNEMLQDLGNYKITDIHSLRKLMKSLGYHRFYKYIYNIYFELKKVRVINLTRADVDFMSHKYMIFEKVYFKEFHEKPNFTVVIYCMLCSLGKDTSGIILGKKLKEKNINKIMKVMGNIL